MLSLTRENVHTVHISNSSALPPSMTNVPRTALGENSGHDEQGDYASEAERTRRPKIMQFIHW